MSIKIPEGASRLLLVEGKSDTEFFIQLKKPLNIPEKSFWIMTYDGKNNLDMLLALIQADSRFPTITHLGIIRDADFDGRAFQHVQSALVSANHENSARPQYPSITQPQTWQGDTLRIGTFIMPYSDADGMLESLILKAFADDNIMGCVDDYFDCLGDKGINPKPEHLHKAQMRVYMTALYQGKMRTFIEGKNVDVENVGNDREKSYLSDIYKMSWWDWNHPVFNDIKVFIRQLVE